MKSKTDLPLVIGVGELLRDLLPAGKQLGGAPANFAYHAQDLGANARMVFRVGDDPIGRESLKHLSRSGLSTDGITSNSSAPTGAVGMSLAPQGKPTFTIKEGVAWDFSEADAHTLAEASRAAAIYYALHPLRKGCGVRRHQAENRFVPATRQAEQVGSSAETLCKYRQKLI